MAQPCYPQGGNPLGSVQPTKTLRGEKSSVSICISSGLTVDRVFGDHDPTQWHGEGGIPNRHAALLTQQLHQGWGVTGSWHGASLPTCSLLRSAREHSYFRFTFLCSVCSSRPQEIALLKSRAGGAAFFFPLFFFSQRKLEVKNERSKSS